MQSPQRNFQNTMSEDKYVLPDVLCRNLDLVICGTAAGKYSAVNQAYYAYPTNKFWKILHQSGLTAYQLSPPDYLEVRKFGIGLTDLAKNTFGSDSELASSDFKIKEFEAKIQKFQPRFVGFNGKTSARKFLRQNSLAYGLQTACIGDTQIFVLPSTSPRAHSHWFGEYWFELAQLLRISK